MWLALTLLLAGPASAADLPLSASAESMRTALAARDGAPSCADLEALSTDAVADLTALVTQVAMPPYVPMRAADCLASGHAEAAKDELIRWVTAKDTAGLARLTFRKLDKMPEPLALELAQKGLAGPHARLARRPLERATNEKLRALLTPAQPR